MVEPAGVDPGQSNQHIDSVRDDIENITKELESEAMDLKPIDLLNAQHDHIEYTNKFNVYVVDSAVESRSGYSSNRGQRCEVD